jgi:ParE toxin of type II toxin-antitoxin system, parDE
VSSRLSIVFTRRAATHVEEAGRWWRNNRTKAPDALREELDNALQLIASQPEVGATARNIKLAGVRRILLRRVNCHLYYRLVESPRRSIEVVAFWHASRGQSPDL